MSSWIMKVLHTLMRQRSRDRATEPSPLAQAESPRDIDLQQLLDFQDDTMPAAFNGLDGTEHDDSERDQPRRRA